VETIAAATGLQANSFKVFVQKDPVDNHAMTWRSESICMRPEGFDAQTLAGEIYDRVCRTDFSAPGFCAVTLEGSVDSVTFRRRMVSLKQQMTSIHQTKTGNTLIYLSASRFDQQETTKPHLDGGPDECFLMLGYEPSEIDARLEIFDYTRCAMDLGVSPKEFMEKHNPMFQSGYDLLKPYCSQIPCFLPTEYQIICINNSSAAYSNERPAWQGVLHTAIILTPDESKRRLVNSTLIASAPVGTTEAITESQQEEFMNSIVIRRRGYDKPHLQDEE
jgi:hypothetical protein